MSPNIQVASTARVVVASTVALTFITFQEAAAVVLNDLASTMFYIGGITEQAIGKPAPWMVLAVMLFSYVVRSIYMESCACLSAAASTSWCVTALGSGWRNCRYRRWWLIMC